MSADLATWSKAQTVTNLDGTLVFTDAQADEGDCRYYRVVP